MLNKEIILTSGDDALGIGDGFILAPTLLGLAEKYQIRHIASAQSYKILKKIENENLRIYSIDEQGHFYTNDHVKAYNLVYWRVFNSLRDYGCHAINLTRKIADLSPYTDILPEIPIDARAEKQVSTYLNTLKRPVIVTQPLVSFYNKMIEPYQQVEIVDGLIKRGYTVVQIGNDVPEEYLHVDAENLIGRNSIDHSMALIKGADCFVGLDSFGQHCAANMRTPAVVIFCGTSPCDFGYDFFSNIWYPNIVNCQVKCGAPMRWLYQYEYTNPDIWSSRNEAGWICDHKSCSKAIKIDDILIAVEKEIKIGRNRDWKFRNHYRE